MPRQLYLVAYDIASPRRLRQALKVARDYAMGGQKSVFECFMSAGERKDLLLRLRDIIDVTEDRFLVLRLDPRGKVRTLGRGCVPVDPSWFYIG